MQTARAAVLAISALLTGRLRGDSNSKSFWMFVQCLFRPSVAHGLYRVLHVIQRPSHLRLTPTGVSICLFLMPSFFLSSGLSVFRPSHQTKPFAAPYHPHISHLRLILFIHEVDSQVYPWRELLITASHRGPQTRSTSSAVTV